MNWYQIGIKKVFQKLETSEKGLTESEAKQRTAQYGPNKLAEEEKISKLKILIHQFTSPLIYILLIAGIVTFLLEEYIDSGVIFAVVILNAVIGFIQEYKTEESVRALKKMVVPKAKVLREGREKEIKSEELVRYATLAPSSHNTQCWKFGLVAKSISITDQVYDAHVRSPDFIIHYIFPGGFIPSVNALIRSVAKATDLKLFHLEDITPHYARTLSFWRERFFANIDAVRKLGYPETFIRMWEYYLCYCEAGFRERYIGDAQMIFTKPDARPEDIILESRRRT